MTQQDQFDAIAAWQTALATAKSLAATLEAKRAIALAEQKNLVAVKAQADALVAAEQRKVDAANADAKSAKDMTDVANQAAGQAYNWMLQSLQAPLSTTGAEIV